MVKLIRSSKAFRTLFIPGAAAGLAAALALAPQAANAGTSNGTITFNGKVLSSTCSLSNGTSGNLTVTLPDVQSSALTSGTTAGLTNFSMNLTGCPTTPSGVTVASYFGGTDIDSTNGYLKNAATTGAAGNVEIQLLPGGSSTPLNLTKSTATAQGSSYVTISSTGTATLNYAAQYYANGAAATPGTVSASVTYTFVYQ